MRHCALNVVLYGRRKRWALTERGHRAVRRDRTHLCIGPSSMHWDGDVLTIDIDEITAPVPSRIRGRVRVHPAALTGHEVQLSETGNHRWMPIAPRARVEVELVHPALRWSGAGYLDHNAGDGALEAAFTHWNWCRAPLARDTAILYEVFGCDGSSRNVALRIDPAGAVEPFAAPAAFALPRTRWGVQRGTRTEAAGSSGVLRTLEDAPFYARSVIRTRLLGESAEAMHESLDLRRFAAPWVQAMLPFRIPRALR